MGFFRKKEKPKPSEPVSSGKQVSAAPLYNVTTLDNELGDCRCIHCHRDFWYDDFIGVCTSLECSNATGFVLDLSTREYIATNGPRRILLRENTRQNYKRIFEQAQIEDILMTKSHVCPFCRHHFYFYACPLCRHIMPRMKKEDLKKTIAPAGIGQSGKTVYMTVLIERLLNRGIIKPNICVISNFAEQNDFHRFRKNHDQLFTEGKLLASTSAREIPYPYLLRTTTQEKGVDRKISHTLWYDFSGELFETAESTDPFIQYFIAVGGIFFFIDPTNSKAVEDALGIKRPGGAQPMNDTSAIEQIHNLLVSAECDQNAPRRKLIAVIVNKVDIFNNEKSSMFFPPESMVWQKSPHRDAGAFCLDDFNAVNKEVEAYVRLHHSNIYGHLKLFKNDIEENIGYFAVSALGQTPSPNNELDKSTGIQPLRVEDPFYWMLWKMGNLPAIGEEVLTDRHAHPPTAEPGYHEEAEQKAQQNSAELF